METSTATMTNVLKLGLGTANTVFIGISGSHIKFLCSHARTMLMMYRATGDQKYIERAKSDLDLARTIKVGFMRPLGALPNEAA
jgi:hypothetical protein